MGLLEDISLLKKENVELIQKIENLEQNLIQKEKF